MSARGGFAPGTLGALAVVAVAALRHPLRTLTALAAGTLAGTLVLLAVALTPLAMKADPGGWVRPRAIAWVDAPQGSVDLGQVRNGLLQVPGVAGADFIARDAALDQLARAAGQPDPALAALRPNPLPDTFVLHLEPGLGEEAIGQAVADLGRVAHVSRVDHDAQALARARLAAQALRAGLMLVLALVLLSAAAGLRVAAPRPFSPAARRVLSDLGAEPLDLLRPPLLAAAFGGLLAGGLSLLLATTAMRLLAPWRSAIESMYSLTISLPGGAVATAGWLLAALVLGALLALLRHGRPAVHPVA
jgi:cell division protein FtsX